MNNAHELPLYHHIINGDIVKPNSGHYIDVHCPATGNLIAKTADGDATDVDLAVNAASRALKSTDWRNISVTARSKLLYQIGNTVLANAQASYSRGSSLRRNDQAGNGTRYLGHRRFIFHSCRVHQKLPIYRKPFTKDFARTSSHHGRQRTCWRLRHYYRVELSASFTFLENSPSLSCR